MKPLEYWNPEGFEISSYKYSLRERVNQTYTTSGGDNTNLCTYTYNELGFRGDSIKKEGFKVMSLGCSITEGVGVNDDETVNVTFYDKSNSKTEVKNIKESYLTFIRPGKEFRVTPITDELVLYGATNPAVEAPVQGSRFSVKPLPP
jgi:hypothetical protein